MARRSHRRRGGSWAAIWLSAVAVGAGAAAWPGCTVTEGNYQILRLIFDGVPDPTLPQGAVGRGASGAPVFVVVHKPFAEEKCDACHRSRYRPTRKDSAMCLECHEGVPTAHPMMHGPVAVGACLWCHSPHESSHLHLLRDTDRTVCAQCHSGPTFDESRVPAHADATRGCLECHSGHGSDAPFLLKPGAGAGTPPPGPASGPPPPPEPGPGPAPEEG